MESKCEKCNSVYPSEYVKRNAVTDEYLCPECYEQSKAKTILWGIGVIFVAAIVIGHLFIGYNIIKL